MQILILLLLCQILSFSMIEARAVTSEINAKTKERAARYPMMPVAVSDALRFSPTSGFPADKRAKFVEQQTATVRQWLNAAPEANKNSVYLPPSGTGPQSLLVMVINRALAEPSFRNLLKELLRLEPDLSFRSGGSYSALTAICMTHPFHRTRDEAAVKRIKAKHMKLVKQIIDLALIEKIPYADLENDINYATTLKQITTDYELYNRDIIQGALGYIDYLKKSAVATEEFLTEHLGVRDVARIGAEYVAPLLPKPLKSTG